MIEITMPRLSDTMEEGSILAWHKQPGDKVEIGDVLVEIETDKATMEYEAYEAGTMSKQLVPEGELVSIGAPIALIDDGKGAAEPDAGSPGAKVDATEQEAATSQESDETPAEPAPAEAAAEPGPTPPVPNDSENRSAVPVGSGARP
jgi:pyruvate dehydrogenase E2 component (dihydrolipoamide acetyltransferase)